MAVESLNCMQGMEKLAKGKTKMRKSKSIDRVKIIRIQSVPPPNVPC